MKPRLKLKIGNVLYATFTNFFAIFVAF